MPASQIDHTIGLYQNKETHHPDGGQHGDSGRYADPPDLVMHEDHFLPHVQQGIGVQREGADVVNLHITNMSG